MKKKTTQKATPIFIDAKDIACGFFVYGLKPTKDKNVMIANTFASTSNTNNAVKFGEIAFKYGSTRVEIKGIKTFKMYYVITKKGNKFILKDNKNQKLKSLFHGTSNLS
jgi:hypothetical protein